MSFFTILFDLKNGYINEKNLLKLENVNFIEKFDKNKLGYILNNLEDIESIYRPDANNGVSLEKYYKYSTSENYINVEYIQNDKGLYGRYQAKNALSGQGMVREARHTIFNDYYVDLDIDNCHPVITKWLCDNLNIECLKLNNYIYEREKIFKQLIKINPDCDREHFKKAFLKIGYGCSDNSYKNLVKCRNDFIEDYRNEILEIQKLISEKFYKFLEINTKLRNEKNKKYNYYGSTLSHICQFVENQLLMHIIKYLKDNKNLDIQDSILCFDGLMINKELYKNEFIDDLKKYFEDLDISINFSTKPMDDLSKQVLKLCNYNNDKIYIYYPTYDIKYMDYNDNYYYIDFISDLIYDKNKKQKNWSSIYELEEFFIQNVNRVLFVLLTQKNAIYAKISDKEIEPVDCSLNTIYYFVKSKKKGIVELNSVKFNKFITFYYNYIKFYNNLEFVPFTKDDKPILSSNNFNLFQGFNAKLLDDYNYSLIEPVLNHWHIVLAGDDDINFKYQLSYFHQIFKYPSRKTKIMMLFKSKEQQIGKGIILNKLIGELIFGKQIYKPNNGLNFINERFNSEQQGSLLNVTEELSTIDDSYNATFDKLKSMCCDDFLNIEPKFGKKYKIQNYTNYIFNTNNNLPVKIEAGDARFAVFKCDERYYLNFNYFNELAKSINQEVADHLYTYIYNLENPVELRNIPKNDFYRSIQFNSYHNSIRFLSDIQNLNFEDNFEYDSWESFIINSIEDDKIIKSSNLNIAYKKWCTFTGERNTSMSRFKSFTRDFIKWFDNKKGSFYDLKTIKI